jgi:hypothetical protein
LTEPALSDVAHEHGTGPPEANGQATEPSAPAPGRRGWLSRQDRSTLALWLAIPAGVVILLIINRNQWFRGDEFGFLVNRRRMWGAGDLVGALFEPHNEHWSTGAFLLYMTLFKLFRFSTYVPYLLLLYGFHVMLVLALRAVLVRAGTDRWLATGGAILMLLMGSGMENLLWAFQIGFVGSIAVGMVALLLSDHDGLLGWRDALGVAVLLVALTFSGPALVMVVVIAVNALWHRRWWTLAAYAGTVVVVFAGWYLTFGREAERMATKPDLLVPYLWSGLTSAVDGATQLVGAAAVILPVIVVAAARRARDGRLPGLVVAMAAGAVSLYVMTGVGRASQGVGQSGSSRYIYIGAALLMPALLMLVADLLAIDGRAGRIATVGFLTWAVVGNLSAGVTLAKNIGEASAETRTQLAAAASLPSFGSMARGALPDPEINPNIDMDALEDFIEHDGLELAPVSTTDLVGTAVELQVREGTPTPGDPAAASVTGVDGTSLSPEKECVRLRNPTGRVVVHARAADQANLVISDTEGTTLVHMIGPDGQMVPSTVHGAAVALDHTDFPVEIKLPFSRALICGAHIG